MAGLEAPWELMESSPERGWRGGMGRGAGGRAWGLPWAAWGWLLGGGAPGRRARGGC
jgi:hypothetical protein